MNSIFLTLSGGATNDRSLSPHLQDLIDTQAGHLKKLEDLADRGEWKHLREHTSHPDSGFDWWMFPIDRPSLGYNTRFVVNEADVKLLRENPVFIRNYRAGVILVAKSWGWDLETNTSLKNDQQKWTGYQVRLGKMLHSLTLFKEDDLKKSLIAFLDAEKIIPTLEPWIQSIIYTYMFEGKRDIIALQRVFFIKLFFCPAQRIDNKQLTKNKQY